MIIQIIFIIGLIFCLVYAFVQRQKSRAISLMLAATSTAGIVFVAFPELSSQLATYVGIGRGADLILYCWLIISLVVSVNLQFKILSLQRNITDLTREISLKSPTTSRK
jgi:hypothetical protein